MAMHLIFQLCRNKMESLLQRARRSSRWDYRQYDRPVSVKRQIRTLYILPHRVKPFH